MGLRVRLDHDHPCLACGAPWRVVEQQLEFGRWVVDGTDCSGRCWTTDMDAYNDGLVQRSARNW